MADLLPQIFAFASNEWHTPWWMARQHLFTRLARRGWPIIYSTGPQSLWERHTEKWQLSPLIHRFDVIANGDRENLEIDRPGRLLPLWGNSGGWSDLIIWNHARHLLQGGGSRQNRQRIAYLWHPRFWPYVELLEADYVVYHIHDAWDATNWPARLADHHAKLVARANLIITTAENMSRDLPGIGTDGARVLPHGVDFQAVESGAEAPCPADLAEIPRPRIGYTGRVNLKLDYPIILEVAQRRPEWHWVFVGATGIGTSYSFDARPEVRADWDRLNAMSNVHFLGVKSREEVPAYLHGFDVLSLPFNSSYVGFPTKLYEYFAAGKPVVSWDGENVRPLAGVIDIANNTEEWVAAIRRALAGKSPSSPEVREGIARAEDWDSRTDTLEAWLREMMGINPPPASDLTNCSETVIT